MSLKESEKAALTLLSESGLRLPSAVIAENTGYAPDYMRQVCKDLLDRELIENKGTSTNPYYVITEAGAEVVEEQDH